MFDLTPLSAAELLVLHAKLGQELRDRGISRTSNNPTGDLAEYLFCKAYGWTKADNSKRGFDATCDHGNRYQIKGRRHTRHSKSRQLGALRDLAGCQFDYLAAVIFDEEYSVVRAAIIPLSVISSEATYVDWTKSHKFMLRDEIWNLPNVLDVTEKLKAVTL